MVDVLLAVAVAVLVLLVALILAVRLLRWGLRTLEAWAANTERES